MSFFQNFKKGKQKQISERLFQMFEFNRKWKRYASLQILISQLVKDSYELLKYLNLALEWTFKTISFSFSSRTALDIITHSNMIK